MNSYYRSNIFSNANATDYRFLHNEIIYGRWTNIRRFCCWYHKWYSRHSITIHSNIFVCAFIYVYFISSLVLFVMLGAYTNVGLSRCYIYWQSYHVWFRKHLKWALYCQWYSREWLTQKLRCRTRYGIELCYSIDLP